MLINSNWKQKIFLIQIDKLGYFHRVRCMICLSTAVSKGPATESIHQRLASTTEISAWLQVIHALTKCFPYRL